ncbi:MAG TPA: NAD(P)H-dependent oxidoreductase [Candidatus Saccharimonadales bacterium]|nr:NAD(P)H-dependent oxidoreductase [Candidatus Saccharimonadales bacterium]
MSSDEGKIQILVIIGSTRQHRFAPTVEQWFMSRTAERSDMNFAVADLRDWMFHYYDAPLPASRAQYDDESQRWAEVVGASDGFVIVTPEYNHGYPAILKSALDAVYHEWVRKPVAFVSFGGWSGGVRAVEQLRQVAVELQMAPTRASVVIQFAPRVFDADGTLQNPDLLNTSATTLLDDLSWWAHALRAARAATR